MPTVPYKIATLCYLFDHQGRVLLIRRLRAPNQGLYSPIGGKLDQTIGESPTQCALREISEETGLKIERSALRLNGMISESSYENEAHWLMFLYEVMTPVELDGTMTVEGSLEWFEPGKIDKLEIPSTDRHIIWPLFWRYRKKFFAAHISCENEKLTWHLEQPAEDVSLQEAIDSDL